MYRIESVAIMCCHVGRVMKPGANSRASQSQSQSHVRPSHALCNTHINKPTVHFQPLTFIANDCSLNVSRLSTFLTEKGFYIMYFTDLLKVMKSVIYMLIIPSLLLPEKQVLAHKFKSIYSSVCLWCMKRRVYSYRDRPLAGSLMGYGPQLHLFQWISLLGSARQHHVRACNWEVMGRKWFERQQRSSLISWILFQQPFKNQTSPPTLSEGEEARSWKMTKGFKDKNQAKEPWQPNLSWFSRGCSGVKYDYFFWPQQSDSVENSSGYSIPEGYLCTLSNLYYV